MAASRKFIREWVAGKLGRKSEVTCAVSAPTTLYSVPGITDITADTERLVDSYLMANDRTAGSVDFANPEWRRITAVNTTLSQISVNRAFTAAPTAGIIYGLLNPTEWNEAINEALTTLYFRDREAITIVADEQEYAFPTWLSYRGQVHGVRYRSITTKLETEVPRFRIHESISGMTLVLMDPVWASTTYEIIVDGMRYHSKLDEDQWGTTCPQPLWQAAVEVAAIHKVYKKYGERFKRQYAQDLAIAERELGQMRAAVLPAVQTREYQTDDDWGGPDIDPFFRTSGWV